MECLETISQRLSYIFELCDEKGGIVKALEDERGSQASIIMHLVVAKEQLQKIQDNGDFEILSIFSKEEIRGLSAIRNIAAHDYEGLNFAMIEQTIRYNLLYEKAHYKDIEELILLLDDEIKTNKLKNNINTEDFTLNVMLKCEDILIKRKNVDFEEKQIKTKKPRR